MYGKTEIKVTKVTKGKQKLNYIKKLPDLRESKKSVEFWIPSRGILTFVGETWIPDSSRCILDSKAQESGFHKQKCHGFRNLDSLTWSEHWIGSLDHWIN